MRREVLHGICEVLEIPCGLSLMSGWQNIEQSSQSVSERMSASSSTQTLVMCPEVWLEAGTAVDALSNVGDASWGELVD